MMMKTLKLLQLMIMMMMMMMLVPMTLDETLMICCHQHE